MSLFELFFFLQFEKIKKLKLFLIKNVKGEKRKYSSVFHLYRKAVGGRWGGGHVRQCAKSLNHQHGQTSKKKTDCVELQLRGESTAWCVLQESDPTANRNSVLLINQSDSGSH